MELLTTLWAIWWARRKLIHEQEYQSPISTHAFIVRYLNELNSVSLKENTKVGNSRVRVPARWIPPPEEMVKINVDGAFAKNLIRGAAAAVCRDARGEFLGAAATVFEGIADPEILESLACSEALSLAADLQVRKPVVASDCANVISHINEGLVGGPNGMIIKEIILKKTCYSRVSFTHERREANGEVGSHF